MRRQREFAGRVVVVTGAASGIGAAIAHRFARAGAIVAVLDRDRNGAERVASAILAGAGSSENLPCGGGSCIALACDVTDETACRRAIQEVIDCFGGIDVLVNNAGITQRSLFAGTDTAVFRRVMDVNFFGAVHCTKTALASLVERRGVVITISSIAGLAPLYERSGYAASKHALHGLFGSLRAELRGTGVDVMLVCPGFTATGIGAAALDGHGAPATHAQSTVGKLASPDEVANAIFAGAVRSRPLLVLTAVGKTSAWLQRLWPGLYERLMTRSIRREIAESRAETQS